ncbi:DUF3592 domain-containing protein [bacterium]|nr:MAG: DUF3592 domain-containing protein [bacterium]
MNVNIVIISFVTVLAVIVSVITKRINIEWALKAWVKLVFVFMAGIGAAIIIMESRGIDQFLEMREWPTVEAKITSSRVEGRRAFHPEIIYEYTVSGETYTGTTDMGVPGFGTKANRLNVASTNVVHNPVGKIITVHYDPQNPSFSQLRIVPTYTAFILLSVASMLFGTGLWGVFSAFIKKKQKIGY